MAACRSCGAAVRWVRTAKGKPMPLDMQSNERGNVVIDRGVGVVLGAVDADAARRAGSALYLPHHASCPQGKAWQRKGSRADGSKAGS